MKDELTMHNNTLNEYSSKCENPMKMEANTIDKLLPIMTYLDYNGKSLKWSPVSCCMNKHFPLA
jgi:hypothetical protein